MKRKPVKKAKQKAAKPEFYLFGMVCKVVETLNDMRAETNERLRVIEHDIGAIQNYVGALAKRKT